MPYGMSQKEWLQLLDDAARAQEIYSLDELEAFARANCNHMGSLVILTPKLYSCSNCGRQVTAEEAVRRFEGSQ